MARSTGPILAIGGLTIANRVIFNDEEMDWRVPIATGIAAMLFSMAEKAWPKGAINLAWLALITSMFVRTGDSPSPIESAATWWQRGPRNPGRKGPNADRGPRYVPA